MDTVFSIEDYAALEADTHFDCIIAFEEAMNAPNADKPTSNSEFNDSVSKTIDKVVNRAVKKVDMDIQKLEAKKKVLVTQNNNFNKEIQMMRSQYAPKPSLTIVNYDYDDGVVTTAISSAKELFVDGFNKFSGVINNPAKMKAKNNILGADYRRVVAYIVDKYNAPADVTTPEGVYAYVKSRFRGEKKTTKVGKGAINQFIATTKTLPGVYSNAYNALKDARVKVSNVGRVLESYIRSDANTQESKKQLPKLVRNFISLANFYIGMIVYCFELQVERIINARVIAKKFYSKEEPKEVEAQKRIEGENTNDEG